MYNRSLPRPSAPPRISSMGWIAALCLGGCAMTIATAVCSAAGPAATPAHPMSGIVKAAKIPPQQIVERLLALGAGVWIKKGTADPVEIKAAAETVGQKFTFARVEFRAQRPDDTPLAAPDYAVLDSLTDVPEIVFSGEAVNDAVLEKLRPFRALVSLTIEGAKISTAEYSLFPAFSELRELRLIDTGTGNAALKTLTQCRKLKLLGLEAIPITDEGMASLGKIPALEELELTALDKLGTAGFAHLAECRALKSVYATGFTILSGMVENLARCKNLEYLALPGTVLKDADIATLSALTKLRSLDLRGSSVSGAAFASWPPRLQLTSLNLEDAAGINDATGKNIERAFPKLEELSVKLAASGFTTTGAASLARLHSLRVLRLGGAGVADDTVAQFARCDGITTLAIPAAHLSDKGAGIIAKLPRLAELSIDRPPVTDAALKSFGRCKELKTLNVARDTPTEIDAKLHQVLPSLTIVRPAAE